MLDVCGPLRNPLCIVPSREVSNANKRLILEKLLWNLSVRNKKRLQSNLKARITYFRKWTKMPLSQHCCPSRAQKALVRINFMKPTEPYHMELVPDVETFYRTCHRLFTSCKVVEMGEPLASTFTSQNSRGCPCGTKSFRIHSITPDGRVPVSPCVYAHDFKVGDLLTEDLEGIIASKEFEAFRRRRARPELTSQCRGCEHLESCRGGCPSRAYLWANFEGRTDHEPLGFSDPYCIRANPPPELCTAPSFTRQDAILVHRDYLCTVIVDPS